jgi:hypothetical protein
VLVRHVVRTVGLVGAAAAIICSGVAAASATSATPIKSGKTVISLDAGMMTAAQSARVKIQSIAPATTVRRSLTLPTAGGTALPPNYVEQETGGIVVSGAAGTVKFTHITMDTAHHVARATVTGHGTIAALALGDPQNGNGGPGFVEFGAFPVTFTPAAVRILDAALHTGLFAKHARLGLGASTVRF